MDPETLEPLPVERLLHGLSAQLIGGLTSAAEQDQSLKQPFLDQLVPALSVGDFPEKELLTSSSWRGGDLCRSEYDRLQETSPLIDDSIIAAFKERFDNYDCSKPAITNGLDPLHRV